MQGRYANIRKFSSSPIFHFHIRFWPEICEPVLLFLLLLQITFLFSFLIYDISFLHLSPFSLLSKPHFNSMPTVPKILSQLLTLNSSSQNLSWTSPTFDQFPTQFLSSHPSPFLQNPNHQPPCQSIQFFNPKWYFQFIQFNPSQSFQILVFSSTVSVQISRWRVLCPQSLN